MHVLNSDLREDKQEKKKGVSEGMITAKLYESSSAEGNQNDFISVGEVNMEQYSFNGEDKNESREEM